MFEAVALAFGLAMDATALAAVRGLAAPRRPQGGPSPQGDSPPQDAAGNRSIRLGPEGLILPLLFGGFQAGMAALGWALGAWGGAYVVEWDHWIAFALLAGIGLKMLFDAWRGSPEGEPLRSGPLVLVGLAVATSIDAAAAGITLPLIPVSPWLALVLIGGVTLVCSALGFAVGRTAGRWLGGKLTALGGAILIAIGVRMLLQHL